MATIIFEIADDIPYSDIELMVNDIQDRYHPLLTKGKLVINGNLTMYRKGNPKPKIVK